MVLDFYAELRWENDLGEDFYDFVPEDEQPE